MGDSLLGPSNVLSFAQIEQLWNQAGGNPAWAPTYAGIAEEESSGQAAVLNNTPATGDYSVGLWQLNFYGGNAGRAQEAAYGGPGTVGAVTTALANNPEQQAEAAVSLAGGGQPGLSNWTADPVANVAIAQGGPLSLAQVTSIIGSKTGGASTGSETGTGATAQTGVAGSSATSSLQLTGIGATLQELDSLMNPSPPPATASSTILNIATLGLFQAGESTVDSVTGLVVRLTFALGFIGVVYFGIKALSSTGGGSSGPGIIDSLQTQQRLGQGQQRLDISSRGQATSEVRAGQGQQRINIARQSESRKAASKSSATAGAEKTIAGDVTAALETVGEAGVL